MILGIGIIILTSIIASINGIQFNGVLSVQMESDPGLFKPLIQGLVNWIYLSLLAFILCKLIAKSQLKIIDLAGNIAFSRFPILFASLMGFVPGINKQDPYSMTNFLVGFTILFFTAWSIIVLFNAIKMSTKLAGINKWLVFGALILLTAITSHYLYDAIDLN